MPLNDDILDAQVRHMIGLQRLSNSEVRKLLALLRRIDARLVGELAKAGTDIGRARQSELLRAVREIVESAYTDAMGNLHVSLGALAEYEGEYQEDLLRRLIPVRFETALPAPAQLFAAVSARPFQGKLLKDWYKELEETAFRRMRDSIRLGYAEGRTTDQMIRDLRGTKANGYKDGILEITRRQAEATVRTAVAHTAQVAREEVFKRNSRLIKAVQWVSTLDGRTSAICRARDGQTYPLDKGPRPPAHPNCRSSVVPVVKSWKELGIDLKQAKSGTRASMNGQVADDLDYSGWLRKQPVEFQEDVLGARKARLFRDGGLTMDRFVNHAGREYTLDELKRREASAWKRANLG